VTTAKSPAVVMSVRAQVTRPVQVWARIGGSPRAFVNRLCAQSGPAAFGVGRIAAGPGGRPTVPTDVTPPPQFVPFIEGDRVPFTDTDR
jgi:hypothetical protein